MINGLDFLRFNAYHVTIMMVVKIYKDQKVSLGPYDSLQRSESFWPAGVLKVLLNLRPQNDR